ncbi:MAG: hypothetical protein EBT79_09570 [Actinobacteria bacterium]|nr:hypothetical protein [Actinomycetota bacterium]
MRKATIGHPLVLIYQPSAASIVPTSVTATVHWPAGAQAYVMARQQGATISGIDDSRTRLTTTWTSGEPKMQAGVPEAAWIGEKSYGQVAVRIIRVDATYTYLSEPLPTDVDAVECGIYLLTWQATIPALHLPAAPVRPILVQYSYSATVSGETTIQGVESDSMAVVWAEFSTGLTDQELLRGANWARTLYQPGTNGYADAISTALTSLIGRIRPELPDGVWEDQLAGAQFRRAHLLATQLVLLDDMAGRGQPRPELRTTVAAEYEAEVARCFARLELLDLNDDNIIQPGEASSIAVSPLSHVTNQYLVEFARQPLPTIVHRPRMDDPR